MRCLLPGGSTTRRPFASAATRTGWLRLSVTRPAGGVWARKERGRARGGSSGQSYAAVPWCRSRPAVRAARSLTLRGHQGEGPPISPTHATRGGPTRPIPPEWPPTVPPGATPPARHPKLHAPQMTNHGRTVGGHLPQSPTRPSAQRAARPARHTSKRPHVQTPPHGRVGRHQPAHPSNRYARHDTQGPPRPLRRPSAHRRAAPRSLNLSV